MSVLLFLIKLVTITAVAIVSVVIILAGLIALYIIKNNDEIESAFNEHDRIMEAIND